MPEDTRGLRYQPEAGHDPAVVVAALRKEGFEASIDTASSGTPAVLVTTADGSEPDREQVRHVLSGTRQINFEGDTEQAVPARFADE